MIAELARPVGSLITLELWYKSSNKKKKETNYLQNETKPFLSILRWKEKYQVLSLIYHGNLLVTLSFKLSFFCTCMALLIKPSHEVEV